MNQLKTAEKKPIILSADEQTAFEQGLRSEATGKDYSLEECFELVRKRRKEWMKTAAKTSP